MNKKFLLWINILYSLFLFLLIIFGNLPTGFMFFLPSLLLVWPFFATTMSLRENKSFLTPKWLLMINGLFAAIILGFSFWRASSGNPQTILYLSPFLLIPAINCYALIKKVTLFSARP